MTLDYITSPLLDPLRHGFFTRKGGASSGIFAGLNCGPGSSDQSEIVAINRARVAAAMDLAPEALVSVTQVHSPDVVTVTAPLPDHMKRTWKSLGWHESDVPEDPFAEAE